jgi:hypothetical protein
MVTRLNSKVFQFTRQIAVALSPNNRRPTNAPTNENAKALGTEMLIFLDKSCFAADPSAAVQVAIQAVLINTCTHIISAWHSDYSFDERIKNLYEVVRHDGESLIVTSYLESHEICLFK